MRRILALLIALAACDQPEADPFDAPAQAAQAPAPECTDDLAVSCEDIARDAWGSCSDEHGHRNDWLSCVAEDFRAGKDAAGVTFRGCSDTFELLTGHCYVAGINMCGLSDTAETDDDARDAAAEGAGC